jgi:hypothetical protein
VGHTVLSREAYAFALMLRQFTIAAPAVELLAVHNASGSWSAAPQHGLRQTCQMAHLHRHLPWDRNIKRLEGGV